MSRTRQPKVIHWFTPELRRATQFFNFAEQQSRAPMSALGQKQTLRRIREMSAYLSKADIP
jgi:hypothetical protein